ncbi:hypothetical protein D3C80_1104390 [compost metagenome]
MTLGSGIADVLSFLSPNGHHHWLPLSALAVLAVVAGGAGLVSTLATLSFFAPLTSLSATLSEPKGHQEEPLAVLCGVWAQPVATRQNASARDLCEDIRLSHLENEQGNRALTARIGNYLKLFVQFGSGRSSASLVTSSYPGYAPVSARGGP